MLAILGMSTVIGMAGKDIAKNFLSMTLGLGLACIGMSPMTGLDRYTFGYASLLDGIPLIPRMIGLFGIFSILKICDAVGKRKPEGAIAPEAAKSVTDDKIAVPSWRCANACSLRGSGQARSGISSASFPGPE